MSDSDSPSSLPPAPKAFVLGAGLGTRLRPLTNDLPKPLVPFVGRPLITWAFDHLLGIGVDRFVVNTHHIPGAYDDAFPTGSYRDCPIDFRFEPILLETAGGIANVRDLLDGNAPFVVYNGDILTDISLQPALDHHRASDDMVTLVLRSTGANRNVSFDAATGQVTDMRETLGRGKPEHQFTGIYIVDPAFLAHLEPGKKESVVPIFLKLIETENTIGGVVSDDGYWLDLGERESYLDAHALVLGDKPFVHETATVHPNAQILGASSIGPNCQIGEGAVVEASVLWDRVSVTPGTTLSRCIVRSDREVTGQHSAEDL